VNPPSAPAKTGRQARRSKRLGLLVPVEVHGRSACGESFREAARTISVNAHGGLIALAARVEKGQTVILLNTATREEQEVRVVYVGVPKGGKWPVGVEFILAPPNFWRIHFPPASPRASRISPTPAPQIA